MQALRIFIASLLASGALFAREWRDTKGRTFNGVLIAVDGDEVIFEKYGAGKFSVGISTSSAPDQAYIAAWRAARASAVVLSVRVFQATREGALVSGNELRREIAAREVPKWYSKLDNKVITESRVVAGWRAVGLPSEHVFIEGLNDVLDKWEISFLVVWPAGIYDYTTVGGAPRRVAKYTVNPPGWNSQQRAR